jgi:hypothetical protein
MAMYPNDLEKAYDVLLLANDSFEGIIKDFDPNVNMLGAINRNMVTCYLDSLLFAMFARLDSFEAMLFDNFNDEPRKRLAAILRLWVNLLRTGRLIHVDITKHLQETLARCGWEGAADIRQQDASEAFTFITGALELPLLTLKMDIYHTGREDKEDDHKFVNERLLEVAIPEPDGDRVITLEECLEAYFNNKIEVKRHLQRQNTLSSMTASTVKETEKDGHIHIETVELSGPDSPLVGTPIVSTPLVSTPVVSTPLLATPTSAYPTSPTRPIVGRRRADSIFTERYRVDKKQSPFDEKRHLDELWNTSSGGRPRSASLRKEVLMPAWQFFSLIPWYTDNVPKTDAQVAFHFSSKRPVLGICLKRYQMLPNGTPKRLDTYIDIPLEIGLPHFVSDDHMQDEGPLFGNFKLVLQSVVCHRGVQVNSGHYISLVRANQAPHPPSTAGSKEETKNTDSWLRFDDLAPERVSPVDIKKALKEESPYLVFYQVQPIDEELANRGDPPSYAEAEAQSETGRLTADPSRETLPSMTDTTATDTDTGEWEKVRSLDSDDIAGRSSMSSNRQSSITFEELESGRQSMSRGRTAPVTPAEESEKSLAFLSTSRRNSKAWSTGNRSRPTSQSGENRLSMTLSRLTGRGSKDKLLVTQTAHENNSEDPVIVINSVKSNESDEPRNKPAGEVAVTSPVKEKHHASLEVASNPSGLGRSKSKRDKGKRRLRSKSREPNEAGQHGSKQRPDRECIVM